MATYTVFGSPGQAYYLPVLGAPRGGTTIAQNAADLINAFTRDLGGFVSSLAERPVSQPRFQCRFWFHIDGAKITVPIPEQIWYLGSCICYTQGQLTVTSSDENQNALVSGSVSRELTGMIGAAGTTVDSFGKIRTLLEANSTFTINVNSGPQITGHLFELIEP